MQTGNGASTPAYPGEAVVDLDAYRANIATLRGYADGADVMAVVKADAYGHGLLPCARAAVEAGVDLLGVAQLTEALTLATAPDQATPGVPVMTWLWNPDADLATAVSAGLQLGVSAQWSLDAVADAARSTGRTSAVHLKIDTGLARGGAAPADWDDLCRAAHRLQQDGLIDVVGVWSHPACTDEPGHPSIVAQRQAFEQALVVAARAGLDPRWRHLANSAGLLGEPSLRYTLVRAGLASYGLTPLPQLGGPDRFGLRQVMTLRARLTLVKDVPAGQGVSYGHTYVTDRATRLGLVPLGYSDGIPRHASSTGPVQAGDLRTTVAGRICMDQFVIDLGPDHPARVGDWVTLFGPGDDGEPSVQDWADAAGTISYEIVTRLGARVPRRYLDSTAGGAR